MLSTCAVRPLTPATPIHRAAAAPTAAPHRRLLGGGRRAAAAPGGDVDSTAAPSPPPSTPPPPAEDLAAAEARLEALERGARRGTGSAAAGAARPSSSAPTSTSPLAEWKDGALLPEGFDAMPPLQKAYNLWAGRRGVLYWSSQAAWYSALGLGGGWVLFRFVLPALGVYKLANGLID